MVKVEKNPTTGFLVECVSLEEFQSSNCHIHNNTVCNYLQIVQKCYKLEQDGAFLSNIGRRSSKRRQRVKVLDLFMFVYSSNFSIPSPSAPYNSLRDLFAL